jgi:hypothetical protein
VKQEQHEAPLSFHHSLVEHSTQRTSSPRCPEQCEDGLHRTLHTEEPEHGSRKEDRQEAREEGLNQEACREEDQEEVVLASRPSGGTKRLLAAASSFSGSSDLGDLDS